MYKIDYRQKINVSIFYSFFVLDTSVHSLLPPFTSSLSLETNRTEKNPELLLKKEKKTINNYVFNVALLLFRQISVGFVSKWTCKLLFHSFYEFTQQPAKAIIQTIYQEFLFRLPNQKKEKFVQWVQIDEHLKL